MIKRLRPAYTEKELAKIYSIPHDSNRWSDHIQRVERSISFIKENCGIISSAADLSCGNGKILDSMDCKIKFYGDYAPAYPLCGHIDETIKEIGVVDLFICSETIEHLDDPVGSLSLIREHTKALFISTPSGKFDDVNPEHYWAWDKAGIKKVLSSAGFKVKKYEDLDLTADYYNFGLVYCE
jgi:hypothetical protein